jgi:hypothetical protein
MKPSHRAIPSAISDDSLKRASIDRMGKRNVPRPAEPARGVYNTYIVNTKPSLDQANRNDKAAIPGAEYEKLASGAVRKRRDTNFGSIRVDPGIVLKVLEFVRPRKIDVLGGAVGTESFGSLFDVLLLYLLHSCCGLGDIRLGYRAIGGMLHLRHQGRIEGRLKRLAKRSYNFATEEDSDLLGEITRSVYADGS